MNGQEAIHPEIAEIGYAPRLSSLAGRQFWR